MQSAFKFPFTGTEDAYSPFSFNLNAAPSALPDTVILFVASSNFFGKTAIPGSTLKLDSISFAGVQNQPAEWNGSFEKWINDSIHVPNKWNIDSKTGQGVNRTTDTASGKFAAEVTTYLEEDAAGNILARAGDIVNGKRDASYACWKGSYPYSNKTDTLLFSYKYLPMPGDSASATPTFRKSGFTIQTLSVKLCASLIGYQPVQIPFDLFLAPDSVVVQFKSSLWQNTFTVFTGSTLNVDNVHFSSQPLSFVTETIKGDFFSLYPNPCAGKFTVESSAIISSVNVLNIVGDEIYSVVPGTKKSITVDPGKQPRGIYFVEMLSGNKKSVRKVVVQ